MDNIIQNHSVTAQSDSSRVSSRICAGALAFNAAVDLTVMKDIKTASASLYSAFFQEITSKNHLSWGIEIGYAHVRSFDQLNFQGYIGWYAPLTNNSLYIFSELGGGFRQEWMGSFRQRHYPLGINLGFLVLFNASIGLRNQYSFRRLFNDPMMNFSEHKLLLGISVFFRNSCGNK